MQTYKWHFQIFDKETENVVKENNKTAAWWHWRHAGAAAFWGVWVGVCLQLKRENDKSEWHFSTFWVGAELLLLARHKPFYAWLKILHLKNSVCLWLNDKKNALNYALISRFVFSFLFFIFHSVFICAASNPTSLLSCNLLPATHPHSPYSLPGAQHVDHTFGVMWVEEKHVKGVGGEGGVK